MKKHFVIAALLAVAMPTASWANRMTDPGSRFTLPDKPDPVPEQPAPQPEPAPPAPEPAPPRPPANPTPPPPVYQPPAPQPPVYQPPAPQPQPEREYGIFRTYGPLPDGRVHVRIDHTFENGQINGWEVYVQDNGANANDQMVILGPHGEDDVWIDCHVGEEWASYGPNSEQFVHEIVSTYCSW